MEVTFIVKELFETESRIKCVFFRVLVLKLGGKVKMT